MSIGIWVTLYSIVRYFIYHTYIHLYERVVWKHFTHTANILIGPMLLNSHLLTMCWIKLHISQWKILHLYHLKLKRIRFPHHSLFPVRNNNIFVKAFIPESFMYYAKSSRIYSRIYRVCSWNVCVLLPKLPVYPNFNFFTYENELNGHS